MTATGFAPQIGADEDRVDLQVPADPAYLAVVRTAAAGLAARLDMSLDEIEDLRIAVDEACVLLVGTRAHEDACLDVIFTHDHTSLTVAIRGPATVLPGAGSFAWTVLNSLVGEVATGADEEGAWVRLTHRRRRGK